VLQGPGVHDQHCLIVNDDDNDVVTLHPLSGQLAVDGLLVTTPTKLVQGSRVSFSFLEDTAARRLSAAETVALGVARAAKFSKSNTKPPDCRLIQT